MHLTPTVTYAAPFLTSIPASGVCCEDGVAVDLADGVRVQDLVLSIDVGLVVFVVFEVCVVGETGLGLDAVDQASADGVDEAAQDVEGEGQVLVPREASGPEQGMESDPHGDQTKVLDHKQRACH